MRFKIHSGQVPCESNLNPTTYLLEDGEGSVAEVWPAFGFNCIRWSVHRNGRDHETLYAAPDLFGNSRPTRSGIPILFPFPNRIRDGQFRFMGQEFQLPLNDSANKNAIHGFACRVPWKILEEGANDESAWITGEFLCSRDAPDFLPLWPANQRLRVTIRLTRGSLRHEAEVFNPDQKPLPFGLGYHHYFRIPDEDCTIEVPAREYWEVENSLPTGKRLTVDASRDLNAPRHFGELTLDDVLTGLPGISPRKDGLIEQGRIQFPDEILRIRMACSKEFQNVVVFTPPHRHAFCIEPYTCTTDAANLHDYYEHTGWDILKPGESRRLDVELTV